MLCRRLPTAWSSAILTVSILLLPWLIGTAQAEERLWKDLHGNFSVTAQVVEYSGTEVILLKSDGHRIKVSVERLSVEDQKYLLSLTELPPPVPPSALPAAANHPLLSPFPKTREKSLKPSITTSSVWMMVFQ